MILNFMGVWKYFQKEYNDFIIFIEKNKDSIYSDWKENIEKYHGCIQDFIQYLYDKQNVSELDSDTFISDILYDDKIFFEKLNNVIGKKLYQYCLNYFEKISTSLRHDVFDKWIDNIKKENNFDDLETIQHFWKVDILNHFDEIDEYRLNEVYKNLDIKLSYITDDGFIDWIIQTPIEYKGEPVNFKDILVDLSTYLLGLNDIIYKSFIGVILERMMDDDEASYSQYGIENIFIKYSQNLLLKFKHIE